MGKRRKKPHKTAEQRERDQAALEAFAELARKAGFTVRSSGDRGKPPCGN